MLRTDLQKPPRGTARARKRDGYRCRWPLCDCQQRGDRIEVAHLRSKSLGGENESSNMMCLCSSRHRGLPSLHSGELKIRPIDEALGTNGPCEFWASDSGDWHLVARERSVGLLETE